MNLADIFVISFMVCIFSLWIYVKRKNSKKGNVSKCMGCANFGICGNKKPKLTDKEEELK